MDTTKKSQALLSLCSGYGGIERGISLAGVEHRVVTYVEIEAFAISNLVSKMESGQLDAAPVWTDLKPCQWSRFEDELTLSLAAIHVPLSVSLEKDEQKKTKDISGLTSEKSSEQFDLFDVSLKTPKDTSTLDSEKSLATWKALVTKRRGEYSQRVKSAHPTREKGSSLWPTVRVSSANGASQKELSEGSPKRRLETEVLLYPTSTQKDNKNKTTGKQYLSPEFCELLMGVPIGWTELDWPGMG